MISQQSNQIKNLISIIIVIISCIFWFMPIPTGLSAQAWHLFIIFISTIVFLIFNPFPMGTVALVSILTCVLTKTLTLGQCLSLAFGSPIVWLVMFAFFLSHGFVKTGLGSRISYHLILRLGYSTLGLSYALVLIDLILAPFIPSVTARGAGIIFPITKSICQSYTDKDNHKGSSKNGGFLMKVCFQSNVITSSLFVTAMAANPLAVKLAADIGISISWMTWAKAAILPGIICLITMPLVLYYLHTPTIKHSDSAPQIAKAKLEEMGRISRAEIIMLLIFCVLVFLWILGDKMGLSATLVALGGLCAAYLFRIINFEDTASDKTAWNTFIWFGTLIMLSGFLTDFGLITWVKNQLDCFLSGFSPVTTVIILSLIYFYIHYLFASTTTHIAVLFPAFLTMFISAHVPATLAALSLSFLSILSSGLTQFGLSSAPIFFSSGYIKTKAWWFLGCTLSLLYIAVFSTIGIMWWKFLGLW